MSVYVRCPTCKAIASVSKGSWNFRSHKTPGAERAGAVQKLEASGYCKMSNQPAPYHLIEKFIRSYKVWPGGVEKTEYSFDTYAPGGKSRSILCESCGQGIVIGDSRGAYEPEKVRAFYRKHKLAK